ncbi:VOC family protein [Sphaerisporangium rubeum]|uniref:PhnB protein n=1 Tax=Sphaerisporangium rubeum TaxID=321317 RepID=A0A7X0II67_9ACTN|nr:VOC family protein [Sphaerisporangium rubeum]MBB6474117.1 PhnB protein [Sphaerisporangium rubeum]
MTSKLNPYIGFDGDAREAMEFYRSVFGGDLTLRTFGEFGAPQPELADKIMHGTLETPQGFTIMGSDTPPGMTRTVGDNITISLSGDDADLLRGHWQQLSESGTVTVPLEKQMWGDEYGSCVDRYGVNWMVDITPQD